MSQTQSRKVSLNMFLAENNNFPGSDRNLSNWKPSISDSNNIILMKKTYEKYGKTYENTLKCPETPRISA